MERHLCQILFQQEATEETEEKKSGVGMGGERLAKWVPGWHAWAMQGLWKGGKYVIPTTDPNGAYDPKETTT